MSTTNVIKAMAEIKRELHSVQATGTNPHFNSRYIRLEIVAALIEKANAEHGLYLRHIPVPVEGAVALQSIVTHLETGEELDLGTVRFEAQRPDPQACAAAYTYARRIAKVIAYDIMQQDDDAEQYMAEPLTDEQHDAAFKLLREAGASEKKALELIGKAHSRNYDRLMEAGRAKLAARKRREEAEAAEIVAAQDAMAEASQEADDSIADTDTDPNRELMDLAIRHAMSDTKAAGQDWDRLSRDEQMDMIQLELNAIERGEIAAV